MIQTLNIEDQIEIRKKLNIIEESAKNIDENAAKLQAISLQINAERQIIDQHSDEIKEKLGLNEPELVELDLPF